MTDTTPPKEESTISPIESEKTETDTKVESKPEVTPVKPEGEVTAEPKSEEKKKEETAKEPIPETINEGYLNKRGPGLLKFWRKTYFAFGSEPTPLQDLQVYYKKNAKKGKKSAVVNATTTTSTAPAETEAADTTAEPSKVEEPTSSDVVEEVKGSKEVEDKKPETKEAETKETETKEAEIKEAEDKIPETKDPEINVVEDKKPETKDSEIKEAEDKKPETKDPEIKESEDKDKKVETKEEEPTTNVNHVFYNNIAHATQTGEGLLFYYRSKNEKKHPIGIINLKEVLDVKELNEHHTGRSFAFRIVTSYRSFELAADSKLERERWIKTVKEKVEQIKESNETIETSNGYKDAYDRLLQGTAFHPVKAGDAVMSDEVFSGDEEDKPRAIETNKRKSIFPFFGGRKPSTSASEAVVASETAEDGNTVTELTKITTTTEETAEEMKSGEVSPKSPQRSSKFLAAFFKKSDKDETTSTDDAKEKEEKAKITEETTNAETSTAAVNPTAETTQHKDHKEGAGFLKIFKSKPKDDTNKGGDNNEVKAESNEPSAEATTSEVKSEEKPEAKSEERIAETSEKSDKDRSFFRMLKDLSKSNAEEKEKVETTEEKVESKSEEKKPEKVEDSKESDKKDEKKKEKKKKDEKKEGDDSSESQSESSSEEGDKEPEPSLVRRVTTKIFRRAKSPKAEEKSREGTSSDKAEVIAEDKKDVVETTDSTEKNDVSTQTAEQTVPESSTEPTETKKKEKSSILLNFGRRISGGVGKRQNSLPPHESTQEKGEAGETGETGETAETAAVATATEATDIENADKTTKSEKDKEPEVAVQKHVIPEGIKKGTLQKQTQIFKTFDPRYFVLTQDKKLHYYRSISYPETQKTIELSSDCKVKIGEGAKFDLETKTRTYKLIAESEDERDSWIKELKELGVASEEHGKKTEEAAKLEVPKSENVENGDIQQSVDNAADKAADAAEASVSEVQETTTKTTNVETAEGTEKTTVTTTTTIVESAS